MANPFDEDNDEFNKRIRAGRGYDPVKSYTKSPASIEDQIAEDEKEIERYLQMSLDSTQRSRQQLESSDKLAEGTARDLVEQREKLERAEKNLDEIHTTTQITQRSLNSLKSLFGGLIKNKFSRAPKELPVQSQQETALPGSKSADQLGKIVDRVNNSNSVGSGNPGSSGTGHHTLNATSRSYIQGTRWEAMDNEIDQNLDHMSSQLARLKTWGTTLGEEVEDQNRMLDRIHSKAERNDAVIRAQDGQMRKLLG